MISWVSDIGGKLAVESGLIMLVFFALAVLGGVVYPIIFLCVCARKGIKNRREKRRAIERKLKYTLPEKDNAFIRTRLNTVLKASENCEEEGQMQAEKYFRLEYARKLLNSLKNASVSVAERLEIVELLVLFEAYLKKTEWKTTELKTVNDALSRVLKLCAKYSVSVSVEA